MPDTLTTITNFINSPPGQLVAGGVLAGIVWKFFERVEAVLNEDTKLEIAVWLLRVKVGEKVDQWPDTFGQVFDRVFGKRHFSLTCLGRSLAASVIISLLWAPAYALYSSFGIFSRSEAFRFTVQFSVLLIVVSLLINALPDYCSLGATRIVLSAMQRTKRAAMWGILLVVDLFATLITTFLTTELWFHVSHYFTEQFGIGRPVTPGLIYKWLDARSFAMIEFNLDHSNALGFLMFLLPSIFTAIWLWLYAASGFLLKASRRFDIGFQWFNRKFDIEKKPLQSIGLVAGALVAVIYWAAVIVNRIV